MSHKARPSRVAAPRGKVAKAVRTSPKKLKSRNPIHSGLHNSHGIYSSSLDSQKIQTPPWRRADRPRDNVNRSNPKSWMRDLSKAFASSSSVKSPLASAQLTPVTSVLPSRQQAQPTRPDQSRMTTVELTEGSEPVERPCQEREVINLLDEDDETASVSRGCIDLTSTIVDTCPSLTRSRDDELPASGGDDDDASDEDTLHVF